VIWIVEARLVWEVFKVPTVLGWDEALALGTLLARFNQGEGDLGIRHGVIEDSAEQRVTITNPFN